LNNSVLPFLLLALFALPFANACGGCDEEVSEIEDAGAEGTTDGGADVVDSGLPDAGPPPADSGPVADSGPADAGSAPDSGPFDWGSALDGGGFDLGSILDGGPLACLPGTLPDFSSGVSGVLETLALSPYSGDDETGVICGDETCASGVPCCVLCGYAACAEVDSNGDATCPLFTQTFQCDGAEDCPGGSDADTCCYTLSGTDCRAEADCTFDIPDLADAGFDWPFPDNVDGGGSQPDAGVAPSDGGMPTGDGGMLPVADGGTLPTQDGGGMSLMDGGAEEGIGADFLGALLDQGAKVCRSTIHNFLDPDCDLLRGEICCTSDRFVGVEIGLCLPALACLGSP
jgi:hypothetical protein